MSAKPELVMIERWPGGELTPHYSRSAGGNFRAAYVTTLNQLDFELEKLDAQDVVVQLAFQSPREARSAARPDGWPRENEGTKLLHPGVVLNFRTKNGPREIFTDEFAAWVVNLRAIALTLEMLRAIKRYGTAAQDQQYTGFTPLGPGNSPENVRTEWTPQTAAAWLGSVSGFGKEALLIDARVLEVAYEAAAKKLHPDKGGATTEFQELQHVRKCLERHLGRR